MASLNQTKELLSIIGNQKGVIPSWMAKDASKRLEGDHPNTDRAEAIIKKLNEGEKTPALADKISKAEKEIAHNKSLTHDQPLKRGMRL